MNSAALNEKTAHDCTIEAARLRCDDPCRAVGGIGDAIEFGDSQRARIPGPFIFWGPYIALDAGVYLVTARGRMEGRLTLDFACDGAATRLKTATLADMSDPVCLVLTKAVSDFEVRAIKTPELRALLLESLSICCAYLAPPADCGNGAAAGPHNRGRAAA